MPPTRQDFEALVRRAIDMVPHPFAALLDEVPVIVRDMPPPGEGVLYGIYLGVPLPERGGELPAPPSVIEIYMQPLLEDFPDAGELAEQVRITVLHELGHHLGMDEDDLDRAGYA